MLRGMPARAVVLLLLGLLVGCGTGQPVVAPATPEPAATATPEPTDAAPRTARVEPVPDEEGDAPVPPDPGPLPEVDVALVGPDGARMELLAEVAASPAARQRGLMLRPRVAEGAGMLFHFPADSEGGFWMRNTLVPLDIAYVDAGGGIVDVLTMEPCTEDPCPGYPPTGPYRYALEVAAGVLTDAEVDPAWRLELPEDLPPAS
jgi:uncharacterized protein